MGNKHQFTMIFAMAVLVMSVAVTSGMIYVAVHFIRKFW
jgi:hypothetical protein